MRRAAAIMAAIVLAALSILGSHASAQEIKKVFPEPAKDYGQRSLEIYEFKKAAQSGPDRGQEIFYYKCWFCHNEYTSKGAPPLKDLFQRPVLLSGQPVSVDSVKQKIREGGPGMTAYKTTLNDADLTDLVSYLKEKCCWDSDAPPRNPRYVAGPGGPPLAAAVKPGPLTGGPSGAVKTLKGDALEGIMVQLISKQSAVRTTVYSDHDGHYEFPALASGSYTLRIARPLEFYPFS